MRVAILQPMYLPWMGYFALMHIVDVFVVFDDAQFVKRSWHHRNRVKNPRGQAEWITVPVKKEGFVPINNVFIDYSQRWREKHIKKIETYYRKAPYFTSFFNEIRGSLLRKHERLASLNLELITLLSRMVGISQPRIILSSNIPQSGRKTDRLISILEYLGAEEYVSGPAAKAYIEPSKFKKANIRLKWFLFNHPKYPQIYGQFVSHLSVIDLLFNVGDAAIKYIEEGLKGSLVENI